MIVYNLTDQETTTLRTAGLVNVPIQVGPEVVAPGAFATIPDRYRSELQKHVNCGALAIGSPPVGYKLPQVKTEVPPTESEVILEPGLAADLIVDIGEAVELGTVEETPKSKRKKRRRG